MPKSALPFGQGRNLRLAARMRDAFRYRVFWRSSIDFAFSFTFKTSYQPFQGSSSSTHPSGRQAAGRDDLITCARLHALDEKRHPTAGSWVTFPSYRAIRLFCKVDDPGEAPVTVLESLAILWDIGWITKVGRSLQPCKAPFLGTLCIALL